jgi:transposase
MTTTTERTRIVELSAQGVKAPKVAEQLHCSVWTVRKWNQLFKKKALSYQRWGARRASV